MEEIKQKVQDLELALNYVCYDAALIPRLSKVWEKLEILQEAVNKKCNIPHVSGSASECECECKKEWLSHSTEYNVHPYGDNIEYDKCRKCGKIHNFKTF